MLIGVDSTYADVHSITAIQLARDINCVQGSACLHAWACAQTGARTGVWTGAWTAGTGARTGARTVARTGARTPFCIELLLKKKLSLSRNFTFGALLGITIGERYFGLLFAHAI